MPLKRILFVGPLWEGSTCIPRMKGLKKNGLDVVAMDSTPWVGDGPKLLRSLNHRFYFGHSVRAMNAAFLNAGAEIRPDAIWIEKGNWIYPSTLRRLRKHIRFIVHYNTDDVFARGSYFWLHRLGLKWYDLYLTTNRWNVKEVRQQYRIPTLRAGMGYDSDFYRPFTLNSPRQYSHEIVFVGHWQGYTERCVNALRSNGMDVKVWGHNWWKAKSGELRKCKHLSYTDYIKTIGGAKIALCFLSKRNRNESTGRSFEIPAIGTFMLAERTAEHEFLYGDGLGAGLFSNKDELIKKARYYLEHDKERDNVASTGHDRCQTLGLSWAEHIRREWPIVQRMLTNGEGIVLPEYDEPYWEGFRRGEPYCSEVRGGM